MIYVNYWHIISVLFDIQNVPADDRKRLLKIDRDDRDGIRDAFVKYLQPIHRARSEKVQETTKETLRYFLNTRSAPLQALFDDLQDTPINLPDDPYTWVELLWKAFYPAEDYHLRDTSGYEEINVDVPLDFS